MPSSLLTNLRQWTYWIAAIVAAVITLLAVFMKESRASKLLEIGMRKVAKGRKDR
jgi:lipoprotein signal peptidase